MKVSFDFDSTLDKPSIQSFAKSLIEQGHEIWIVTSRLTNEKANNLTWNDDLFAVAKYLNIPKNRIHFTCGEDKSKFFQDKDFIWHLDDDSYELSQINKETKTIGISCWQNNKYQQKCLKLLK